MSAKKVSRLALLVAFALILSYVESFLPVIPIPGAKLGLANIATLLCLYLYSPREALVLVVLRTSLSAFLFTGFSALMYALAGGLLSLAAMCLARRIFKDKLSIAGISILGAVFHHIGQMIVAVFVLQSLAILTILPYLLALSLVTGLFTSVVAKYILRYVQRFF